MEVKGTRNQIRNRKREWIFVNDATWESDWESRDKRD